MFTEQSLMVSGFSIVRYSVKPSPALPSAKYQVLLTGTLPGFGVGDGVGLGEGDGLGEGVGLGEGDGLGDGDGDGVGVGVGTPFWTASPSFEANSSLNQTLFLLSTASPSCGWVLLATPCP